MFEFVCNRAALKTSICCGLLALSANALCATQTGPGSDETILIEQEHVGKICYSDIFKKLSSHVFGFEIDQVLSTKNQTRDVVVRQFTDYAERINYKVDLNHDEVTLRMNLNF